MSYLYSRVNTVDQFQRMFRVVGRDDYYSEAGFKALFEHLNSLAKAWVDPISTVITVPM